MNTSSQLLIAIMMAVAVGSFFWAYKATSVSVFQPRRRDRRASFRPQAYDRRKQAEDTVWNAVIYWVHRIVWLFVAVAPLIVIAVTFGPRIGLT